MIVNSLFSMFSIKIKTKTVRRGDRKIVEM